MDKYIIANWKMNNSFEDIPNYIEFLKSNLAGEKNIVVCVPSVMIKTFSDLAGNSILTGAQNCFYEDHGAYTGEISANMAKSAGASFVLIGHSERRHKFNETSEDTNKKMKAVLSENLTAVLCVGELLEEKENYKEVLIGQITKAFEGINDFSKVIIAYEPVWAIGTGKVATTEDIVLVHSFIKDFVKKEYGTSICVLYGGSIKPENSKKILSLDCVDGVLIGGASLKADDFTKIAKSR